MIAEKRTLRAGLIFWEISVIHFGQHRFWSRASFSSLSKTPNPVGILLEWLELICKIFCRATENVTTPFRSIDLILFCYDLTCLKSLAKHCPSEPMLLLSVKRAKKAGYSSTSPFITPLSLEKGAPQPPPISSLIQRGILSSQACHSPIYLNGIICNLRMCCRRSQEHSQRTSGWICNALINISALHFASSPTDSLCGLELMHARIKHVIAILFLKRKDQNKQGIAEVRRSEDEHLGLILLHYSEAIKDTHTNTLTYWKSVHLFQSTVSLMHMGHFYYASTLSF